jgi:hypothetical protein
MVNFCAKVVIDWQLVQFNLTRYGVAIHSSLCNVQVIRDLEGE